MGQVRGQRREDGDPGLVTWDGGAGQRSEGRRSRARGLRPGAWGQRCGQKRGGQRHGRGPGDEAWGQRSDCLANLSNDEPDSGPFRGAYSMKRTIEPYRKRV